MNPYLRTLMWVTIAYLGGSINFAIIVTYIVAGEDIRQVGNRNAGTANVARNVGKQWAAIVFIGDFAKGFIPLYLSSRLISTGSASLDYFLLTAVGIGAIIGHIKPVYHGFRGGGGLATAISIFIFFVPTELCVSMIIALISVAVLFRDRSYWLARWVPMIAFALIPLITLATAALPAYRPVAEIRMGGQPWYAAVGALTITLTLLIMNRKEFFRTVSS